MNSSRNPLGLICFNHRCEQRVLGRLVVIIKRGNEKSVPSSFVCGRMPRSGFLTGHRTSCNLCGCQFASWSGFASSDSSVGGGSGFCVLQFALVETLSYPCPILRFGPHPFPTQPRSIPSTSIGLRLGPIPFSVLDLRSHCLLPFLCFISF